MEKTTLYWKIEDGPEDAPEEGSPDDVGPAWLYLPDGTEQAVEDGEWITRAAAIKLASEQGYELQLDD